MSYCSAITAGMQVQRMSNMASVSTQLPLSIIACVALVGSAAAWKVDPATTPTPPVTTQSALARKAATADVVFEGRVVDPGRAPPRPGHHLAAPGAPRHLLGAGWVKAAPDLVREVPSSTR